MEEMTITQMLSALTNGRLSGVGNIRLFTEDSVQKIEFERNSINEHIIRFIQRNGFLILRVIPTSNFKVKVIIAQRF